MRGSGGGPTRPLTAANGRDALAVAKQRQPQVIVLDLMMPIMDGRGFLNEIAKDPVFSAIPVVVISASVGKYGSAGAVEVLKKPLNFDSIGLGLLVIYVFFSHRTTPEMVAYLSGMLLFFVPVKRLAALHILLQESKFGVDRLAQILAETGVTL